MPTRKVFDFASIDTPITFTGTSIPPVRPALPDEQNGEYVRRIQDLLIDLFIFSDRRGVSQLRNCTINILAEKREAGWPWLSASYERVCKAFSNLPSDSAMCRFLVDEAAWCWTGAFEDVDQFPDEFCAKVMKRWMQYDGRENFAHRRPTDKIPPWRKDICKAYHDHGDEIERKGCQAVMQKWTGAMAWKIGMEPVVELKSTS